MDYKIFSKLMKQNYPNVTTALHHNNPLQLLIATILSAQCTDERVNKVTKSLFKKYRNVNDFANANLIELEQDVKSTGFYRNKAKSIKESAEMIVKEFRGKVPDSMAELLQLRGVARKTANVVLGNAFDKNEGVVVDTHVKRLSFRLGFTKNTNPVKIEKDLMKLVPKKDWIDFSHWLILHGRNYCKAITPFCSKCFLKDKCPHLGVIKSK